MDRDRGPTEPFEVFEIAPVDSRHSGASELYGP